MKENTRFVIAVLLLTCAAAYFVRNCRDTSYDAVRGTERAVKDLTREEIEEWKKVVTKHLPRDGKDAVSRIVDIGHGITRRIDEVGSEILPVTIEDEIKIGKMVHQRVSAKHKMLNAPDQIRRLNDLAAPLLEHSQRSGLTYTFYIIDEDVMNAFTHLGGYVYVYRGLLDVLQTDSELQFVLAHEIGHCEHKHVLRGMGYRAQAYKVGGVIAAGLIDFLYKNIAVGYSEFNEFEADLWAYETMRKIGRTKEERLACMRRFVELFPTPMHSKAKGVAGQIGREIRDHYRTHPPSEDRLEVLEQLPY